MASKLLQGQTAFLFDLDGTLIDSVYQHALAWQLALQSAGIHVATATVHRRIGMSGGLIMQSFEREAGKKFSKCQVDHLEKVHASSYKRLAKDVRALPGAHDLLQTLSGLRVQWAIATSGKKADAHKALKVLKVDTNIPVITRDDVKHAKPEPDLFLAAAEKLGVPLERCVVVGDSVWDLLAAQRARALGVGLLSGGFGEQELERAGAYRVYRDPEDLLEHLEEVGVRRNG